MPDKLPTDTEIPVQKLGEENKRVGGPPKILLLVLVVVVLIILGAALMILGGNQSPRVVELTREAQSSYLSGDFEEAQEKYSQALAIDKDDPEALAGMITSIVTQGNQTGKEQDTFNEAKPYIDSALESNGNNLEVLLAAGYAYETAGDYEKALELYERATKSDSKNAQILFRRGHVLEFLGRKQDAYKDYEAAYEINPNDPLVLIARGNMLLSQSKLQESFDSFLKASEAQGISSQVRAEALTAASLVRGSQEDFKFLKEATELSEAAVKADPDFAPALAAHGYNLFLTAPDWKEGIEFVQRAIEANPRIAKNYFLLAAFHRADRNYAVSIDYLKQALEKTDNDNTLLGDQAKNIAKGNYSYELAKTYSMAGMSVDTLSLIKDAVRYNPELTERIREDTIRNNLFRDLQENKEFIDLIGI
jgi:tetratricopeptide (TPR) repeat protein